MNFMTVQLSFSTLFLYRCERVCFHLAQHVRPGVHKHRGRVHVLVQRRLRRRPKQRYQMSRYVCQVNSF